MNFLSFLKDLDNNRRRSKRIVINLLYLLIPIVILANTFSSDRIITECEEIHHYNTELQEEIALLKEEHNTSQRQSDLEKEQLQGNISILDEQRERIKQEVAELERQRDTILLGNSNLAEIAEGYKKQRDQARNQRDSLQQALTATRGKLGQETGRANLCEAQKDELQIQYDEKVTEAAECNANLVNSENDVTRLNNDVAKLRGEKDRLQIQYDEKVAEVAQCNLNLVNSKNDINRLNNDVTKLRGEKDRLQGQLDDCNTNISNLRKELADCENNASSPAYEVNFRPIEVNSPPVDFTLLTSVKYTVEVNGKAVATVCPGECEN